MGAVTVAGMLACEASAIANGWTEEQLLNLAGERLGLAIGSYFAAPGTAVAYTGKGHNAGDALVALRILRDRFGWKIFVRPAFPMHECAPLTLGKWDELDVHPLDRPPVPGPTFRLLTHRPGDAQSPQRRFALWWEKSMQRTQRATLDLIAARR